MFRGTEGWLVGAGLDEGLSFWRRFLVMPAGKALWITWGSGVA